MCAVFRYIGSLSVYSLLIWIECTHITIYICSFVPLHTLLGGRDVVVVVIVVGVVVVVVGAVLLRGTSRSGATDIGWVGVCGLWGDR